MGRFERAADTINHEVAIYHGMLVEYAAANREYVVWPYGRRFDTARQAREFAAQMAANQVNRDRTEMEAAAAVLPWLPAGCAVRLDDDDV